MEIEKGRSLRTIINYDHYISRFLDYGKVKECQMTSTKTLFVNIACGSIVN